MLLVDVTSPHAFGVHASVGASAEGATQPRFFAFGPTVLQLSLLRRTPATRRLELSGIAYGGRTAIDRSDVVGGIEKPFGVGCHQVVGQAILVQVCIWKVGERGMYKNGVRVVGTGVHCRMLGNDESPVSEAGVRPTRRRQPSLSIKRVIRLCIQLLRWRWCKKGVLCRLGETTLEGSTRGRVCVGGCACE